ncbi:MAG: hypothetical protein ABI912_12760 [Actinomycetota bacterium]
MCCEGLLCAACTGPVNEGRCATCRSARAELHDHRGGLTFEMMGTLAIVIALLVVLAQR